VSLGALIDARKGEHPAELESSPPKASCACVSMPDPRARTTCHAGSETQTTLWKRSFDRFRRQADSASGSPSPSRRALRLADGTARLAFLDDCGRRSSCSQAVTLVRCAATACRRSTQALLIQQPHRRLPVCDGLGCQEFFDRERVSGISLSLRGRRDPRLGSRERLYFQLIQSLARQYDFDIEMPLGELPQKIRMCS